MIQEVWGFFYNSSCCESAAALQELYTTEQGALRAMNIHKQFERLKYQDTIAWYEKEKMPKDMRFEFGFDKAWFVEKINVKE